MHRLRLIFSCLLVLACPSGCCTNGLAVERFYFGRDSLASTFVGSPDPRQIDPPQGEKLVIRWHLPAKIALDQLQLLLTLVYSDDSRTTLTYPISHKRGMMSYTLLRQNDIEKGGLLTYRAEIIDGKGDILQKWEHILWFDHITIEDIDIPLG